MAQKINPRLLRRSPQNKGSMPHFSFYAKKGMYTLLGQQLWNYKSLISWQKQTSIYQSKNTRRKAQKKGALVFCNYWQKGQPYSFSENQIYYRTVPKTLQASYNVLFPKVKKAKSFMSSAQAQGIMKKNKNAQKKKWLKNKKYIDYI